MGRALALTALFASGSDVYAQQQDSILKQAFKVFGFATDVGAPADFVTKTRPGADPDYFGVQLPPEPARPTLKDPDLKAMKTDLDGVEKQHDALRRQAFPPAAKALAEQRAAQKKPSSNTPGAQ